MKPDSYGRTLTIALPLEYTAFCLLHEEHYVHYSRARVGEATTGRVAVARALGDLALAWDRALRSASVAAAAWELLRIRVRAAARAAGPAPGWDLHRTLPDLQADAMILRYRLALTDAQSAQLMGVEEPVVASQLRLAWRQLPRATDLAFPSRDTAHDASREDPRGGSRNDSRDGPRDGSRDDAGRAGAFRGARERRHRRGWPKCPEAPTT
ncbi:hypothetical protein [Streptomyces sp. 184]|uniref:hypothetical protein n=1 Tax=Streptomyces sp. 184 TaxID=1827526 RepID=UPI003891C76A